VLFREKQSGDLLLQVTGGGTGMPAIGRSYS
jgi:hypothetical protein